MKGGKQERGTVLMLATNGSLDERLDNESSAPIYWNFFKPTCIVGNTKKQDLPVIAISRQNLPVIAKSRR